MSTLHLIDLPNELLVQILRSLGFLDLIHSSLTCRLLYRIINDTPILQYNMRLELAGFQDCGATSKLTSMERLTELETQRENWTNLRFRKKAVFPMPENSRVWELAGGVLAHGLPAENITTGLAFVELPSVALGTPGRTWRHPDLGVRIRDFTMDPSQDLVVVLGEIPADSQEFGLLREQKIHLFSMSTGEIHPSATSNPLAYLLDYHINDSGKFVTQIMGDIVGVFFHTRNIESKEQLTIWNWKSGKLLIDYKVSDSTRMESFCFLSHNHFILSRTHHRLSTTASPFLQIYEFLDPEVLPFNLTPRLVRSFQLPHLVAGSLVTMMDIRSEPSPWYSSQKHTQGKPFMTRANSQVLAVSIDTFQPVRGMNFDRNSYVLFVQHSTLLEGLESQLSSMDLVIPWDKWGPEKTRLLRTDELERVWVCYMHGSRYVTLDGPRLRMLDFNPWPIRQANHSTPDLDLDEEDDYLIDIQELETLGSVPQAARCRIISASEPTMLPRGTAFGEDIETRLPYRDIISNELFDLHALMIDEDCLVGLHRRQTTKQGRAIEILCF